jgi:hypothetical protein
MLALRMSTPTAATHPSLDTSSQHGSKSQRQLKVTGQKAEGRLHHEAATSTRCDLLLLLLLASALQK